MHIIGIRHALYFAYDMIDRDLSCGIRIDRQVLLASIVLYDTRSE